MTRSEHLMERWSCMQLRTTLNDRSLLSQNVMCEFFTCERECQMSDGFEPVIIFQSILEAKSDSTEDQQSAIHPALPGSAPPGLNDTILGRTTAEAKGVKERYGDVDWERRLVVQVSLDEFKVIKIVGQHACLRPLRTHCVTSFVYPDCIQMDEASGKVDLDPILPWKGARETTYCRKARLATVLTNIVEIIAVYGFFISFFESHPGSE
ncbi:hypothetical protein EDB19DRAFT_1824410 [Suillus lakei]|nr:hypothetical protein EDB19DRAFT_1824410 [Suillus lakei]